MAFSAHGFRFKKRWQRHTFFSAITILIPLTLIFALGEITHTATRELFLGLSLSVMRLFFAYCISLALALILLIIFGEGKLGAAVLPFFDVLQNLPSFALIPFFVLWLGYSTSMVILFAATSIVWPILFYALSAVRNGREDLSEAAKIFGAKGTKRIMYYLLPTAFPSLVTGSIVGLSIGWEAVIGVEIIGLSTGIGGFLNSPLAHEKGALPFAVLSILFLVFLINKLVWTPLQRKSHLYA